MENAAPRRRSLLISHPGALQLVYGIHACAREIGYETTLWTGYHFDEEGLIERIAARAPAPVRARLMRELRRRHSDLVPPSMVVRLPWLEVTTVAALRLMSGSGTLPRLLGWRNALFDRLVAAEVRRHPPSWVMPVDGAALATIRAARAAGAGSLLNQTIGQVEIGQRILREEARLRPDWADSMPSPLPGHLLERARREVLEAECVLAPSDYVRSTLMEIGVPKARIRVIPYGVRLDRFTPAERSAGRRVLRILYVGQISQRKGLAYLLEAVRRLARTDIELLLVGSLVGSGAGLAGYGGLFRHLPNRPHAELAELYRSADLFVYPSLHEGSAQAIMEAMASGLAAIVTPNAGSVVREGIEGHVVPIRDVEALAGRIEALCLDRERLRALGAAARRRAEAHDWSRYGRELSRLLEEPTARPAPLAQPGPFD